MKKLITLLLSFSLIAGCTVLPKDDTENPDVTGNNPGKSGIFAPALPFPTSGNYAVPPMFPTNKTEDERNEIIISLFRDIIKNNLIVDSNGPQDRENFRMVFEHTGDDGHITVSESHGYGLMMLAYMSGSEDKLGLSAEEWRNGSVDLKDYFDAMLRTVIAFPSDGYDGTTLFTWKIMGNEIAEDGKGSVGEGINKVAHFVPAENGSSATDGDMDIIYSLLLADKQWGSDTKFDGRSYKEIALDMLEDFWENCINDEYYSLLLGDWAKDSHNAVLSSASRSSDFILSHLYAYKDADPEHDWQKVIDATMGIIEDVREAENALGHNNGLISDFVIRGESGWKVPDGRVLEGPDDRAYGYNACRIPWRIGTYYMLFGDTSIYDYIIKPIDEFAKEFSGWDLGTFGPAGMDGESIGWTDAGTFTAPFLVSAAASGLDQSWVNAFYEGWTEWRDIGGGNWQPVQSGLYEWTDNHYGDYVSLLAMIAANGYWWMP